MVIDMQMVQREIEAGDRVVFQEKNGEILVTIIDRYGDGHIYVLKHPGLSRQQAIDVLKQKRVPELKANSDRTALDTMPDHRRCAFPTRPGIYEQWEWKYVLHGDPSSNSQSSVVGGQLYRSGVEVVAEIGQVMDTPLGKFAYFGREKEADHYNWGWLNTCTYNDPVFDANGEVWQHYRERFEFWRQKVGTPAKTPR